MKQSLAKSFAIRTYLLMALALVVSAIFAFLPMLNLHLLLMLATPWAFLILFLVELVLVFVLSAQALKMKPGVATLFLALFAAVNGLTLTSVFIYYRIGAVFQVFLLCALFFVVMAIVGSLSKIDLTKVANIALVGLIAAIIGSLVNWFFNNELVYSILNVVILIIFVALTAFDAQKVKQAGESIKSPALLNRLAVPMALSLYLDFINMFMALLGLTGRRR